VVKTSGSWCEYFDHAAEHKAERLHQSMTGHKELENPHAKNKKNKVK